jgi:N-acetylneuraminic acid mutarotase
MRRRKFITLIGGGLLAGGALRATFAQGIGRWTIGPPMPSARTEVAVAEVGGKIYVVGGFGGERELEIYDSVADRWSRGASIPRALHHAAAVGLNDKLYVIGGFVEGWTPTDDVHEYDQASDRWRRLAALPTTRGALAAAVLGGKIHAIGGIGWRGRNTPAHEVYDPAANSWTALAYVPTARDHLAVAAMDGRLYAVGGRIDGNYSRNLAANEAYDPATNRWEQRAPLPTARSGIECLRDGCSFSAARHPLAPSTRRKPMMPGATAGAAMRACRPRATALAQRPSPGGFTSSQAAQRPVRPRRQPMRFSCREDMADRPYLCSLTSFRKSWRSTSVGIYASKAAH